MRNELSMPWFCSPGVLGTKLGAVMPTCLQRLGAAGPAAGGKSLIFMEVFSVQTSSEEQGSRGRWKEGCSVLGSSWSHLERDFQSADWGIEWELSPQNILQCLHSQIPHPGSRGGGKKKPVQLELPFELILHFPGQCFSHAPTFKANWKYFRAVSIHSLICLIAV